MKNFRSSFIIAMIIAIAMLSKHNVVCQEIVPSPFRNYAIQTYNNALLETDVDFRQKLISLEDSIHNFLLFGNITNKVIPVVFHILQSPGMPHISDSTIIHQLHQLNFDFNNLAPAPAATIDSFVKVYGSHAYIPQISFCLPDTIDGMPVAGNFIRTNVAANNFTVSNDMKSYKTGGSDPILPKNCLNIWICNLPDSIAGFAQMPGGPLESDGIVISYKYLIPSVATLKSLDYNKGKTLTHLVGNYLGVYELWNEVNPCYDDYVNDTPIHNEPNHGFEIHYVHYSICPGHEIEMIINFMDNAFDSMAYMFTRGQVYRMQCVLNSIAYRGSLCNTSIACNDSVFIIGDTMPIPPVYHNMFKIYPNLTNYSINLDVEVAEPGTVYFNLYDVTGKVLMYGNWSEPTNQYSKELVVSSLYPGIYYISLRSKDESKTFPIAIIE